jgi:hypothetical protein
VGPTEFDRDVAAFGITSFPKTLAKRSELGRVCFGRARMQKSDKRNSALLRASDERRRGRRPRSYQEISSPNSRPRGLNAEWYQSALAFRKGFGSSRCLLWVSSGHKPGVGLPPDCGKGNTPVAVASMGASSRPRPAQESSVLPPTPSVGSYPDVLALKNRYCFLLASAK